jgi:beta-lactamase class A
VLPLASLVKIPLALAALLAIDDGRLNRSQMVEVQPGSVSTPGPVGLTRFQHPATIAIEDLIYLSTALSDNIAADALLQMVPLETVAADLAAAGIAGIDLRHGLSVLTETPGELLASREQHLAQALAIDSGTAAGGHLIPQLDIARANVGTARALTDLLTELWRPTRVRPTVAAQLRSLLGANVHRQRLTPDFAADNSQWSSKTGTLLNLRHEAGVVEHADGQTYAVVALSESCVPAGVQPAADATLASVARALHDRLRES